MRGVPKAKCGRKRARCWGERNLPWIRLCPLEEELPREDKRNEQCDHNYGWAVSFCAYPSHPAEVRVLPEDEHRVPDAIITTPANDRDVRAAQNIPVSTEVESDEAKVSETETTASNTVITVPANAKEIRKSLSNHTFRAGAKVKVNWRGHGEYYPAIVTGVYKAGANGSRTTYDVVYESDGEAEKRVSNASVRPRGHANVVEAKHCGHALVTDCHPAYLADVPDLARAHVTPTNYRSAVKGPERSK